MKNARRSLAALLTVCLLTLGGIHAASAATIATGEFFLGTTVTVTSNDDSYVNDSIVPFVTADENVGLVLQFYNSSGTFEVDDLKVFQLYRLNNSTDAVVEIIASDTDGGNLSPGGLQFNTTIDFTGVSFLGWNGTTQVTDDIHGATLTKLAIVYGSEIGGGDGIGDLTPTNNAYQALATISLTDNDSPFPEESNVSTIVQINQVPEPKAAILLALACAVVFVQRARHR